MKSNQRTKDETFCIEIAHAFAKYGVTYQTTYDDRSDRMGLWVEMKSAIDRNWDEIVSISMDLEGRY